MIDTVGLVWFVIITEAAYWFLMAAAVVVLIWALRRELRNPAIGRAVWACAFGCAVRLHRIASGAVMCLIVWLMKHEPQGTR